jgi:hypothetical protein
MMLAVAKCRLMAILRLAIGPALTGPSFLCRNDREYGESIMHPDIVLLVVLAALAVWTEVDKLWRRRKPQ